MVSEAGVQEKLDGMAGQMDLPVDYPPPITAGEASCNDQSAEMESRSYCAPSPGGPTDEEIPDGPTDDDMKLDNDLAPVVGQHGVQGVPVSGLANCNIFFYDVKRPFGARSHSMVAAPNDSPEPFQRAGSAPSPSLIAPAPYNGEVYFSPYAPGVFQEFDYSTDEAAFASPTPFDDSQRNPESTSSPASSLENQAEPHVVVKQEDQSFASAMMVSQVLYTWAAMDEDDSEETSSD